MDGRNDRPGNRNGKNIKVTSSWLRASSSPRTAVLHLRLAYLYFTQFHYSNCQQTVDRDLVPVPIEIKGY